MSTTTAKSEAAFPTERAEPTPLSLGYASPIARIRPPKPMSAAVVALAVGLLLLLLACFVLLRIVGWMRTGGLSPNDEELVVGLAGGFGGVCTFLAAFFLFVGLKWLGGIARSSD
jgi:hypothetical protein